MLARADEAVCLLTDVLTSAEHHNHDLIAAGDDVAQALAARLGAGEQPNPVLSGSLSKFNVPLSDEQHQGSTWSRSYDWIFSLSQTIELGGKRGKRLMNAEAGIAASEARRRDAKRMVTAAAARAYLAVIIAERNQHIVEESAQSLEQEATIATQREKSGDLALIDREQIEIAAAQRRLDADAASHDQRAARIALQFIAGLERSDGWRPGDDLSALERLLGDPQLPEHPPERSDILAARQALEQARVGTVLARAGRIPDPTISVQYEHNPPDADTPGNSVGLGISVPIPVLSNNDGAIAGAEASVLAAEHALMKAQDSAAADLANARLDLATANARQHRYQEVIVPRAERAWETVSFAYGKGAASLLDLLAANRTRNDVRLAALQAQSDALAAAIILRANYDLPMIEEKRP